MAIKKVHILLVEDNEGDILLTLNAFEESKVDTKISVARNGKEALDFLYLRNGFEDSEHVDLILLDINIPIYDGFQVLEVIKKDENLKLIPVIVLTTSSNKKDIEKAYENHANGYVAKPISMEEFLVAMLKIEQFWFQLCKFV